MRSRHVRAPFLYRALLVLTVVPLTTVLAEELISEPEVVPSISLSITNLQRLGLEANGLIRAARSRVDAAEAGVISASAYPNPALEFVGGHNRASAPGPIAGNSYGAYVSQRIENPFLRIARIGSAEADVEASQAGLSSSTTYIITSQRRSREDRRCSITYLLLLLRTHNNNY